MAPFSDTVNVGCGHVIIFTISMFIAYDDNHDINDASLYSSLKRFHIISSQSTACVSGLFL